MQTQLRPHCGPLADTILRAEPEVLDCPAQTAQIVRYHLHYKMKLVGDDSAPASLVAKHSPENAQARMQFHQHGLYARELSFYREFGPDPGIPLPVIYSADIDPDSGEFIVLMEDLGTFRQGDFWAPNINDVRLALVELARFHRHWWCTERTSEARWLGQPEALGHFEAEVAPMLPTMLGVIRRKYGDAMSQYLTDLCMDLVEGWGAVWTANPLQCLTVIHGDYHPNEMYFAADPQAGSLRVADWQMCSRGSPGLDVQRILLTGLSGEDFVEHFDSLLDLYHAELLSDGLEYSRERLVEDVRQGALITIRNWLFALAFTDRIHATRASAIANADLKKRMFDDYEQMFRLLRLKQMVNDP